jgi:hypothetical protein
MPGVAQRILGADRVLNTAFGLVGRALRFQLGVAGHFADGLLYCALDLVGRAVDPILVDI